MDEWIVDDNILFSGDDDESWVVNLKWSEKIEVTSGLAIWVVLLPLSISYLNDALFGIYKLQSPSSKVTSNWAEDEELQNSQNNCTHTSLKVEFLV